LSRSDPHDNSCLIRNLPKQYKVKDCHTTSTASERSAYSESGFVNRNSILVERTRFFDEELFPSFIIIVFDYTNFLGTFQDARIVPLVPTSEVRIPQVYTDWEALDPRSLSRICNMRSSRLIVRVAPRIYRGKSLLVVDVGITSSRIRSNLELVMQWSAPRRLLFQPVALITFAQIFFCPVWVYKQINTPWDNRWPKAPEDLHVSTLREKLLNNSWPTLMAARTIKWQLKASPIKRLNTWAESKHSHAWFIWQDIRVCLFGMLIVPFIAFDLGYFEFVPAIFGLIALFCLDLFASQAYKWGIDFYRSDTWKSSNFDENVWLG
jgi:hypothetical protein